MATLLLHIASLITKDQARQLRNHYKDLDLKQISLDGVSLEMAGDAAAQEVPPITDEPTPGAEPPTGETPEI